MPYPRRSLGRKLKPLRKKKPGTQLTAAKPLKSGNNLPSRVVEYGLISKIIELEDGLDRAIELSFRRISATKISKGKRPGSPVLAGRNLESYDPQAHPWTNDILQKWRKLQAKRAEARMAAANAKAHKHHMNKLYDELDRKRAGKPGTKKK